MTAEPVETYEQEEERAFDEAYAMVHAFFSVGIEKFGVTRKMEGFRTPNFKTYDVDDLIGNLRNLLMISTGNGESLIVRPFYAVETSLAIIQADDLDYARADRIAPFAFCITETSPGNYQAFICVADCDDYQRLRQGIILATGADPGATCAARLAGSINYKRQHAEAYFCPRLKVKTFPRVQLAHAAPNRVVNQADLRAAGLLVDAPPKVVVDPERFQRKGAAPRRLPSYAKSLASVRRKDNGEPDRSAADLLFAVTCLRWKPRVTPDEIADLLREHSEKVAEKSNIAAEEYIELTIEEAMRRA